VSRESKKFLIVASSFSSSNDLRAQISFGTSFLELKPFFHRVSTDCRRLDELARAIFGWGAPRVR